MARAVQMSLYGLAVKAMATIAKAIDEGDVQAAMIIAKSLRLLEPLSIGPKTATAPA